MLMGNGTFNYMVPWKCLWVVFRHEHRTRRNESSSLETEQHLCLVSSRKNSRRLEVLFWRRDWLYKMHVLSHMLMSLSVSPVKLFISCRATFLPRILSISYLPAYWVACGDLSSMLRVHNPAVPVIYLGLKWSINNSVG